MGCQEKLRDLKLPDLGSQSSLRTQIAPPYPYLCVTLESATEVVCIFKYGLLLLSMCQPNGEEMQYGIITTKTMIIRERGALQCPSYRIHVHHFQVEY
jgi:hypothetical protein